MKTFVEVVGIFIGILILMIFCIIVGLGPLALAWFFSPLWLLTYFITVPLAATIYIYLPDILDYLYDKIK